MSLLRDSRIFASQVTDRNRGRRPQSAAKPCSEDQGHFPGGGRLYNAQPSCFSGTPSARRTARSTVIGASWRIAGSAAAVQRPLLYLGEINDSQELAWRKSIAILEEGAPQPRTLALFPEDRCEGLLPDASIVRLRLNELRLCRPRQWGGCWLALSLWRELELDCFWGGRLPPSRKGTRWDRVLLLLTTYRLLAPGSE